MLETELAIKVITYMENMGWETYKEVGGPGGCADIVGVKGNKTWIVECKIHPSLKVIEQVHNWIGYTNYLSAATVNKGNTYALSIILKLLRCGYLYSNKHTANIYEFFPPKELEVTSKKPIIKYIKDFHKEAIAGSSGGSNQWTPFKQTVKNAEIYIKAHPGCSIKELVNNIDHHYASAISAMSSIPVRINEGIIKNIYIKHHHGKIGLFFSRNRNKQII